MLVYIMGGVSAIAWIVAIIMYNSSLLACFSNYNAIYIIMWAGLISMIVMRVVMRLATMVGNHPNREYLMKLYYLSYVMKLVGSILFLVWRVGGNYNPCSDGYFYSVCIICLIAIGISMYRTMLWTKG